MFTHWLLYNLPAGSRELGEDVPRDAALSIGARQGTNSFGDVGYGGACPPAGNREHRYVFKLYALDSYLAVQPSARKEWADTYLEFDGEIHRELLEFTKF